MRNLLASLLCVFFLAMADTPDFSATLDKLWTFDKPAQSQARFREELARHPAGSPEALEIETQIARTDSLQRKFADADRTLDAIEPRLAAAPARVKVRYFLERGRTRNSAGERPAAVALFEQALAASAQDQAPGADYYRVDALHMLAIAAPPDAQLAWNEKALAAATASPDARARGWAASLHNNIGWTYFDKGDAIIALSHWEKALPLREAAGNAGAIRIAKWTIARGYRATGRLDEARALQVALVAETERAGEPDGYVYEEMAEISLAKGDAPGAAPWAAKAYALLKDDAYLKSSEAARLARLERIAQGKAP